MYSLTVPRQAAAVHDQQLPAKAAPSSSILLCGAARLQNLRKLTVKSCSCWGASLAFRFAIVAARYMAAGVATVCWRMLLLLLLRRLPLQIREFFLHTPPFKMKGKLAKVWCWGKSQTWQAQVSLCHRCARWASRMLACEISQVLLSPSAICNQPSWLTDGWTNTLSQDLV